MKTSSFAFAMLLSSFTAVHAGENPGKEKATTIDQNIAAPCVPGTATADIDISNVRAAILINGNVWWNPVSTRYEVPKGSGMNSLSAGAIWIGGIDASSQIHLAAQTYGQNGSDFWPGPIDSLTGSTDATQCIAFDRIWKVSRAEVIDFIQNGTTTPDLLNWPAAGNVNFNQVNNRAPFHDVNGDGIYDPAAGDYPGYDMTGTNTDCCGILHGDQTLWWCFNDVGNIQATGGLPLGLEVQAQGFAFNSGITDVDNATFYQFKMINRSNLTYNDCYFGWWADPDLGNDADDFVGCDVGRSLAYCYNGDLDDDTSHGGYGMNPPAVGIDLLQGPLADPNDGIDNDRDGITDEAGEQILMSKFICYENINGVSNGNPNGSYDFLHYLHAVWLDGIPLTYGENGRNPSNPMCNFMYPDNTDSAFNASNGSWTEVNAGILPGDMRFVMSAGSFTFQAGEVRCITLGVPWARDTSGMVPPSVSALLQADDVIQDLFDNCFMITGMSEIEDNPFGMSVSPVPFHDHTTITFTNKKGSILTLTVYDLKGQQVRKAVIAGSSYVLNRGGLRTGVYFINLTSGEGESYTQKVILE